LVINVRILATQFYEYNAPAIRRQYRAGSAQHGRSIIEIEPQIRFRCGSL
jgi:hypothetical protein